MNQQRGFSGEGDISLGSMTWNVADGYTKMKILKLLLDLDKFETIALYGQENIDDVDFFIDKNARRVEAINRLLTTLRQLISNCKFSLKKDGLKEIPNFELRLGNVAEVIDGVSHIEENHISHQSFLVINEEHFKKCFDVLVKVKEDINFPINDAGLIFRSSEEIDLDKIENDIVNRG